MRVRRSESVVSKHRGGHMPPDSPPAQLNPVPYSAQDTETRLNHYLAGPTPEGSRTASFELDGIEYPVTPAQRRRLVKRARANG